MEIFCSAAFLFMVTLGKYSSPEIPPDVSVVLFPYSSEDVPKRKLYILHLDINATYFPKFLSTFFFILISGKMYCSVFLPHLLYDVSYQKRHLLLQNKLH